MTQAAPTVSGARVWLLAARPATLPAAIAPVLAGSAAATVVVDFRIGPFVAALLGAIFIQIGANYANDLADFQRGADDAGRLGPTRATQAGLVSAGARWRSPPRSASRWPASAASTSRSRRAGPCWPWA